MKVLGAPAAPRDCPCAPAAMPTHPPDNTVRIPKHRRRPAPAAGPRVGSDPLSAWLSERGPGLAEEWSEELRARGQDHSPLVDDIVADFLLKLTSFLPLLLGTQRGVAQELWARACALFGTMSAKRGLAAGEVIEEFQVLRELLIRDFYQTPPRGGGPTMREALRLNRVLDLGVTHASVGHTDAMFFDLLERPAGTDPTTPAEAVQEAQAQLRVIEEELREALGHVSPDFAESTER